MSTRSDIIVQRADGSWKRVYCHWDGYLTGNGKTLAEHYTTQEKIDALVEPGDMSSLDVECTKPEGHTFDSKVDGYTVYYGRDRGEEGTGGKVGKTLKAVWPPKDTWTEFTYVWSREHGKPEGAWYVTSPEHKKDLELLSEALVRGETKAPALVKAFGMVFGQHKKQTA